jgi:hypothetical protein
MATNGAHGEYLQTNLKLSGRDEFSNPNRSKTISIFTLDPALRKDIIERIGSEPALAGYRIRSTRDDTVKNTIQALRGMMDETRSDRILIMDARHSTLTLLRPVYNRVVTMNRRDFTRYAYSVVIADGPMDFLKPTKTLNVFTPYLLELKKDFGQSLFFYDPLIHYQTFETVHLAMDEDWKIAENLPDRVKKELVSKRLIGADDDVKVKHIRKHFRGLRDGRTDNTLRQKRMSELLEIYLDRLTQAFPEDTKAASWPTREGYFLEGYGAMHLYPFFFEQLIADLVTTR